MLYCLMKQQEISDIIDGLPKGRTLFHYFKDRYALELLSYFAGTGITVRDIKASPYSRFLRKPIMKEVLDRNPSGVIDRENVRKVWPRESEVYLLTLGSWGGSRTRQRGRWYYQTSRPGFNLVLQLNFSGKHNEAYQAFLKPQQKDLMVHSDHPNNPERCTLAWARMDIDLHHSQALIEEVQTDWIKIALDWKGDYEWYLARNLPLCEIRSRFNDEGFGRTYILEYIKQVLRSHMNQWDEAMLFAAIWFLREELGIRNIFYHTFESGNLLKGLEFCQPPRSLYTRLPARFCFQPTHELPLFLQRKVAKQTRKKLKHDIPLYKLEF